MEQARYHTGQSRAGPVNRHKRKEGAVKMGGIKVQGKEGATTLYAL